jgi:hypothetical protein
MAENAKSKTAKRPKQDALVTWRMEWFPVQVPQNKLYTDKLVSILEKRVRRAPTLYALYNRGRLVGVGQSDSGITRLKAAVQANKKRAQFDRFALYTLAKRRHLNDIEAITTRIMWPQRAQRNFARAKNLGDVARRDVRSWSISETRRINRSLRPLERRYESTRRRLDKKEVQIRKRYLKRIEKAKDKARQRSLRSERDRKLKAISTQRRSLQPWRNSILSWQAKARSFQSIKI